MLRHHYIHLEVIINSHHHRNSKMRVVTGPPFDTVPKGKIWLLSSAFDVAVSSISILWYKILSFLYTISRVYARHTSKYRCVAS